MGYVTRDIGAYYKAFKSLRPQSVNAAADVNGAGVDRAGYLSAKLVAFTGNATGSPSAQSQVFKLQDSADNSTFADVPGATLTITADDTVAQLNVNLGPLRRYLRLVYSADSTFTGGSSPANIVGGHIHLSGAQELPIPDAG